MKLIQTKDYLLLIDEEAEIKEYFDGYVYQPHWKKPVKLEDSSISLNYAEEDRKEYGGGKIIAYRKLNEEAKELDLPLLPNPFRGVDINIQTRNFNKQVKNPFLVEEKGYQVWEEAYIEGFDDGIAQSKQFSLEDVEDILIKYLEEGFLSKEQGYINPKTFLQSLSTQQLPKEFIPEYYTNGDMIVKNRNGVRELIGTYKY